MTPVRMWIGVVLVALGVIGILEATGTGTGGVADWWPIAVIGLGVAAMFGRRRVSLGPLVIVALGFVLLADQQSWTDEDLFGPALLIVFGLAVLFGVSRTYGRGHGADSSFAMFAGTKVKNRSEHLTKTDATAIFGGVTLDLREAHIDKEATVDAIAVFGGVDILVPRGWRVAVTGTPILGELEDKTTANGYLPPDAPVLKVNGLAVCGGVDIANQPRDAARQEDRVGDRVG
ncbi:MULTISPECIES: LiaF transmembrane domain-containing protein [unclassified Kribbella]|uniref:LiaF transmembrane domain-containing protein n=1 Tax=unclassified Kribbella TaxID=2644121 RepID=UPI003018F6B3